MCVFFMRVCVCVYVRVCEREYESVCVCVFMREYVCVCVFMCLYACVYSPLTLRKSRKLGLAAHVFLTTAMAVLKLLTYSL